MNTTRWIIVLEGRQRNTSSVAIRITRSVIDDRLFRDMHAIGVRPPLPSTARGYRIDVDVGFYRDKTPSAVPGRKTIFLVFYAHNYM